MLMLPKIGAKKKTKPPPRALKFRFYCRDKRKIFSFPQNDHDYFIINT